MCRWAKPSQVCDPPRQKRQICILATLCLPLPVNTSQTDAMPYGLMCQKVCRLGVGTQMCYHEAGLYPCKNTPWLLASCFTGGLTGYEDKEVQYCTVVSGAATLIYLISCWYFGFLTSMDWFLCRQLVLWWSSSDLYCLTYRKLFVVVQTFSTVGADSCRRAQYWG